MLVKYLCVSLDVCFYVISICGIRGIGGRGVIESVWFYIIFLMDIIGFYKVIKNSIDYNYVLN